MSPAGKANCRLIIKNFADLVRSLVPKNICLKTVDIYQQDESRVGQQGSMTRIWAPKGTRPRKVKQKQFISSYIYGAACATTGDSFGLILPEVNTQSMQLFIDKFSKHIIPIELYFAVYIIYIYFLIIYKK